MLLLFCCSPICCCHVLSVRNRYNPPSPHSPVVHHMQCPVWAHHSTHKFTLHHIQMFIHSLYLFFLLDSIREFSIQLHQPLQIWYEDFSHFSFLLCTSKNICSFTLNSPLTEITLIPWLLLSSTSKKNHHCYKSRDSRGCSSVESLSIFGSY